VYLEQELILRPVGTVPQNSKLRTVKRALLDPFLSLTCNSLGFSGPKRVFYTLLLIYLPLRNSVFKAGLSPFLPSLTLLKGRFYLFFSG